MSSNTRCAPHWPIHRPMCPMTYTIRCGISRYGSSGGGVSGGAACSPQWPARPSRRWSYRYRCTARPVVRPLPATQRVRPRPKAPPPVVRSLSPRQFRRTYGGGESGPRPGYAGRSHRSLGSDHQRSTLDVRVVRQYEATEPRDLRHPAAWSVSLRELHFTDWRNGVGPNGDDPGKRQASVVHFCRPIRPQRRNV